MRARWWVVCRGKNHLTHPEAARRRGNLSTFVASNVFTATCRLRCVYLLGCYCATGVVVYNWLSVLENATTFHRPMTR